ncbi:AraC-like DNA-binding protein [Catalinimonas alkaloidigena]|uniref:helix-turn-helix domain-containing protein n=1 Tax=Catalinimonas alkaloidigena TaxID=1075417 RepID=UPI002405482B|nr:AraC family transcriptional regulator [Catalinimonas alkaloidigena]MDF9797896.1 AraC-like DNA-binding protein [Catalinimonas alkaloidigena]
MKYEIIQPNEQLRDFISHFWVGTWDATTQKPNTQYYVVASSLTEITFAFAGESKQSDLLFSTFQGHTHLAGQFSVAGFYHLIGIAFYSYAIPAFFHIPASEVNKEFISLHTFLGPEGAVLNERIALASSTQQRINILSDYFISRLKKQRLEDVRITQAIQLINESNGRIAIENLARHFCLSHKQFYRRFKAFTGFSPKMYSRIIRFESVIHNYPRLSSLTETAYRHGYYDQAHFIHEFKSFTGFSPTEFWKLSNEAI